MPLCYYHNNGVQVAAAKHRLAEVHVVHGESHVALYGRTRRTWWITRCLESHPMLCMVGHGASHVALNHAPYALYGRTWPVHHMLAWIMHPMLCMVAMASASHLDTFTPWLGSYMASASRLDTLTWVVRPCLGRIPVHVSSGLVLNDAQWSRGKNELSKNPSCAWLHGLPKKCYVLHGVKYIDLVTLERSCAKKWGAGHRLDLLPRLRRRHPEVNSSIYTYIVTDGNNIIYIYRYTFIFIYIYIYIYIFICMYIYIYVFISLASMLSLSLSTCNHIFNC